MLFRSKVPGSIFIGMIVTAIFGMVIGQIPMPHGIVSGAPSIAPTFGQAVFHLKDINTPQLFMVVLTFLLVTFFDTAGTLIGMTQQAGMVDKNGKIPRIGKAFLSDSLAMVEGSVLGTAPLGTSVESSAGIAMGGRTGLTAIFVGMLTTPAILALKKKLKKNVQTATLALILQLWIKNTKSLPVVDQLQPGPTLIQLLKP